MIIFRKLRYKNFLATGNEWTEIELDKHKTTLIIGENGSGKSTILDALSFVLFNKPFRTDCNKPQLVNSIIGKHCVVEVEFTIGTTEYKIVRGIKPSIFEVYENDMLLNQDANVRDYQDYLEKNILKTNHRSFLQIEILGSANYIPFMRLSAQHRREVVEDILDLTIFSLMNSLLLTKRQQNDIDINQNVAHKNLLNQRIELLKKHADTITSNNNRMIEDKKERIRDTKAKITLAQADHVDLVSSKEEMLANISNHEKVRETYKSLIDIEYKIENKIKNFRNSIDFFHNTDTCPTCSQHILYDHKEDIIKKKNEALSKTENALADLKVKIASAETKIEYFNTVLDDISVCESEMRIINNNINSWQGYIAELESEIKHIESHNQEVDKSELDKVIEELEQNSKQYNELSEQKRTLNMAGVLLKDSGIKARIIKQYIPIINKLINKYLSMLDFFINFTINERFEEKILSRFRDEFSYGSFSEGEKFRINLAILFTWRAIAKLRNSINTNILFLDEVFDSSLDIAGTEEFLKIINQTEAQNIFIISHKTDQLLDRFENTIRFEKHHNFSRIASI